MSTLAPLYGVTSPEIGRCDGIVGDFHQIFMFQLTGRGRRVFDIPIWKSKRSWRSPSSSLRFSLSRAWPCFRVFGLGGARASRAGDGALAIVNFFQPLLLDKSEIGLKESFFGEAPKKNTRGACFSPD